MAFIKLKEDFVCENCGFEVRGTGYTNHCPRCLFSKHVDIDPGDRLSKCGGLMEPSEILKNGDEISIMHSCINCGFKRKNKKQENDNMDLIIKLSVNKN